MSGQPKSIARYVLVLCGLLGLLGLTIGLAFLDLGPFNLVVALGIAFAKALLVMWFFMELAEKFQAPRIAVGVGIFMLLILVVLAMTDYGARPAL